MQAAYTPANLQRYAYFDYITWQENLENHEIMKTQGQLECFCLTFGPNPESTEEENQARIEAGLQDFGVPLHPLNPLNDDIDPDYEEIAICKEYADAAMTAYLINSSLGYLVTGVNWVIRTIIIMLITWIHYKTETTQLTAITLFTFLAQFFNTAFLFLFVNANMSEQPLTFGLNDGPYTDFNTGWFKSVGNVLVDAMMFNAWFPILEVFLYLGIRELYRFCDRGYSCIRCSKYNTRSKTLN
jgi:hypothetical protein